MHVDSQADATYTHSNMVLVCEMFFFFFLLRCCIFNKPLIDENLMLAVTNSLFLPAHMQHHAFSFPSIIMGGY